MSFIQDIYETIANESETKGTFFSVVNYLVANDDQAGIKKKDMEDRFAFRKSFSDIMVHLKEKNIVSEETSNIVLNSEAKDYLKPILQNVLAKSYGSKYGELPVDEKANPSEVSILLDCRSELYKAFKFKIKFYWNNAETDCLNRIETYFS